MFQVSERQEGRTEERQSECEHNDNRSVGCIELRNTVKNDWTVSKEAEKRVLPFGLHDHLFVHLADRISK